MWSLGLSARIPRWCITMHYIPVTGGTGARIRRAANSVGCEFRQEAWLIFCASQIPSGGDLEPFFEARPSQVEILLGTGHDHADPMSTKLQKPRANRRGRRDSARNP